MKLIMATAAVLTLTACSLSEAERRAMADVAIDQIAILNAQGIDPLTLDEDQLVILSTGCAFAPFFYPEAAADISAACDVIREAAK